MIWKCGYHSKHTEENHDHIVNFMLISKNNGLLPRQHQVIVNATVSWKWTNSSNKTIDQHQSELFLRLKFIYSHCEEDHMNYKYFIINATVS